MKVRIYVETSVISYLTARPSRDLIMAAHQALTQDFWRMSQSCEFLASQLVVDEASRGDVQAAQKRLHALQDIALLDVGEAAI